MKMKIPFTKTRKPEQGEGEQRPARGESFVPAANRRGHYVSGGGWSGLTTVPREWRSSSMQCCGLWPWISGSSLPIEGAPMGPCITNGAPIGFDPIAWFEAGIITNPSMFALALPGYGKSTYIRHMLLGMNGRGIIPLVPGDLRPDYVDLAREMGGEVIELAPGKGHLNILDPGELTEVLPDLPEKQREELLVDAHQRKVELCAALISILRKGKVTENEYNVLDRGVALLEDTFEGVPVIGDLIDLINSRPAALSEVVMDRGSEEMYKDRTDSLLQSLQSLNGSGRFGKMFSEKTTAKLSMDRPAVFDTSGIRDSKKDVQAGALLACWSTTFASVNLAGVLADLGRIPNRHYFIVLDELWRALRSGPEMVDRIDHLTRMNRLEGVGQAMITHTVSDLEALPTEEEIKAAKGFIERAGCVVTGALPRAEMQKLSDSVKMSRTEEETMMSWADPGSWSRVRRRQDRKKVVTDQRTGKKRAIKRPRTAPGVGKFLIKVGGRPGIPLTVKLTDVEIDSDVNNTIKRWEESEPQVQVYSENEVTNAVLDSEIGEE